jgi:hypothetical protein
MTWKHLGGNHAKVCAEDGRVRRIGVWWSMRETLCLLDVQRIAERLNGLEVKPGNILTW